MKYLCLCTLIILTTPTLTSCSWTAPSEEQPTHIKASLSEGKNNFEAGNYATAYRQLLPPAVRGNKDAQYAVGYMYYYGKGIDRNADLAENWLRKAANKGDSRARAMLKELNEHKIHPVQKKTEAETETEDD